MTDESGFTLTELLIGSLLSLLVLGGLLTLLDGTQATYADRRPVLDAQQTGRILLERLQRDLHLTGVGLAWLVPPLPLLLPTDDGGLEIRHNQGGPAESLTASMSGPNGSVEVADVTGFEPGQEAAIYDALGNLDLLTLTAVDADNGLLYHDGASKAYDPADGAAVTRLQTITYGLDDRDGITVLTRSVDGDTPQVIAADVDSLALTFLDDADPPQVFVPGTVPELLRIQSVVVRLTLRAVAPDGEVSLLDFQTRVSPRALVLS